MPATAAPQRPETIVEQARRASSTYPAAEAAWDTRYFGPQAPELTADRMIQAADEAIRDGLAAFRLPSQGGTTPPPIHGWPDPDLLDAIEKLKGPREGLDTIANRGVLKLRPDMRAKIGAELRRRGHRIYQLSTALLGRIATAPDPAALARQYLPPVGDWAGLLFLGLVVYAGERWGRRR